MQPARPELLGFLAGRFPGAACTALAGDASTRRFYRIAPAGEASRIVMDYGAAFTGETDDIRLARIFLAARLPVPRVLEGHAETGCLILEDLGETSLGAAIERKPGRTLPLLELAVDLAAEIDRRGTPELARSERRDGPALDSERFRFEMEFFLEHFAGGFLGRTNLPRQLSSALHTLADLAAETPRRVLCHRDYHSRNLMVVSDGSLAMVDIQDARWGPDTYDLASLLRDAYLEIDSTRIDDLIARYREKLGREGPDAGFPRRFDIVSAQRMLKALGTFGYQIRVMGRERYREGIPRTLRRLETLLPRRAETRELGRLMGETGLLQGFE